MTDRDRQLDLYVTGAAAAHQQLLAGLDGLTDEQARRPSLLPGWSVGHVLTHIANNARGLQRMVDAAAAGEVGVMYPGGTAGRNADIEAGADRSAAALVTDVRTSAWQLEQAWAMLPAAGWEGTGETVTRIIPVREIPMLRWRETAVHHADLGLGYSWADWPADFVRIELGRLTMGWASRKPMGLTELPTALQALPENERVAWLFGRIEVPGVEPAGPFT